MVIIRNRTIMWTNHEQYIGTSYDNNSETRILQVNRILPAGTDIADFVFNITIKFSNGQNSVIMLGKEVVDDVINLTWQIGRNSLLAPGPAFVQISATDSYGSIKWSTYESAVYIGNYIDYEHAGDVEMSEFERLEAYYYDLARKMVAVFESEELRETNEATRQTNEAQRAQETEELIARSEEALRIAEGAVGTVSEKLGLAKSYAVGDEEAREGSSTDNAKYYKEQIQASAEQISANADDIAEEVERATAAEAAETERATAAETALQNMIKNAIADEYNASTTYTSSNPYCIYENKLYKLKVASSTGNLPTNTSYWKQVSIREEIQTINSDLSNLDRKAFSFGAIAANGSATYKRPENNNKLFAIIFCKRNSSIDTAYSVYMLTKINEGLVVSKISENEQSKLTFTYNENTGEVGITNASTVYVYVSILSFDFAI